MATTITHAQASLLSTSFLDDLGSNEITFDASEDALISLAAMIIENAQKNLNQSGQVSSGNLSDSFIAKDPQEVNGSIHINIEAADYYDYQNKGVKGTKSGSSKNNYSFKNDKPGEAMVNDIKKWLEKAGLSSSNVSKKHTISAKEKKDTTISEIDSGYAAARSIKQHGIKGTGYLDKAVELAQSYASQVLGKALATDVINSINGNSN